MTKYEKEIYFIINHSAEHLTASQVFSLMKEQFPGIVLATVYNNIHKLCQAGMIRKLSIEGSPDRYDRIQRHDHLICSGCGKLSDMDFLNLTEPLRRQVGHSFLSYSLQVFYLCSECAKSASPPKIP